MSAGPSDLALQPRPMASLFSAHKPCNERENKQWIPEISLLQKTSPDIAAKFTFENVNGYHDAS